MGNGVYIETYSSTWLFHSVGINFLKFHGKVKWWHSTFAYQQNDEISEWIILHSCIKILKTSEWID